MHDIFDGVCIYDMQHVLYDLIFIKKYFTTETLNFRIISFNYGSSISNKPVQFKEHSLKEKPIKMTANEMRTFVRTCTHLVGDLVLETDPVWLFYLILRDIIDIVLSRHIQEESLISLSRKISEHHRIYTQLFNDTLKPKHHLMVHYPTIIKMSGCPTNFACDRFEANHQPSVQDSRGTASRRNIAYTLSVKEQLRVAHRLLMKKGLSTVLDVGPECFSYVDPLLLPCGFRNDETLQVKHITFKGTRYQNDTCVVVGSDSDEGPQFGLIVSLLVNSKSEICIVYKLLSVLSYSTHYHAYVVHYDFKF